MAHEQSIQQVSFDYSSLSEETRTLVVSCTGEIRSQLQKTTEGMIEAGRRLVEVKAALKHGQFGAWLSAEFSMTDRMARNLMNVYVKSETVSDLGKNLDKFAPSALYLLAERSTSERVVKNAVKRAKQGENVRRADVQTMNREYALASSMTRPAPKPVSRNGKSSAGRDDVRARCKALLDVASDHLAQEVYEWLAERLGVSS